MYRTIQRPTGTIHPHPHYDVRVMPTKADVKCWVRGFMVAVAMQGLHASAAPLTVGASMGLLLPSDRLVTRDDYLGAPLLPGPTVGIRVVGEGVGGRPDLAWEGGLSLCMLQSRTNLMLRTQFLPMDLGLAWELVEIEQLSLRLRAGGGPALVTTNLGDTRTVALAQTYLGGRVQRVMHHLTVALEVGVGVLWQSRVQDTVRADLVVMTR